MTIVQCKKCFTGNHDSATVCENCKARLSRAAGRKPSKLGGMITVPDEAYNDVHMLETAQSLQRAKQAKIARRALAFAALLYVLRASVVPVIYAFYKPEWFATITGPKVTFYHYFFAASFGCCYLWARRDPFRAPLFAAVLYLTVVVPQIWGNPVFVGGGHLGKIAMGLLLLRSISAGIVYRTLFGSPVPIAPASSSPPVSPESPRKAA